MYKYTHPSLSKVAVIFRGSLSHFVGPLQQKGYVLLGPFVVCSGTLSTAFRRRAMATPQQEKRTSPRHHVKLPAKLHTQESHELVETRDLSQSGIFLECATKIAEGSSVDIVMI